MASGIHRLSVNECTRDSGAAWIRQRASNCRCRLRLNCFGRNKKRSKKNQNQKHIQPSQSHFHSLSPSRAGVEGCPNAHANCMPTGVETPSVSWLGRFHPCTTGAAAAFPFPQQRISDSLLETVARAENLSPYSRAAATAFHRLPMHGVSGGCRRRAKFLARRLLLHVTNSKSPSDREVMRLPRSSQLENETLSFRTPARRNRPTLPRRGEESALGHACTNHKSLITTHCL
jgi:hypothetical protein